MDNKVIDGGRCTGKSQATMESISKDFEKKGCSFEIAFRALEEGIYTEAGYPQKSLKKFDVRGIELKGLRVISNICPYGECDFTCYYKDYKKTWWLRKDKEE